MGTKINDFKNQSNTTETNENGRNHEHQTEAEKLEIRKHMNQLIESARYLAEHLSSSSSGMAGYTAPLNFGNIANASMAAGVSPNYGIPFGSGIVYVLFANGYVTINASLPIPKSVTK